MVVSDEAFNSLTSTVSPVPSPYWVVGIEISQYDIWFWELVDKFVQVFDADWRSRVNIYGAYGDGFMEALRV